MAQVYTLAGRGFELASAMLLKDAGLVICAEACANACTAEWLCRSFAFDSVGDTCKLYYIDSDHWLFPAHNQSAPDSFMFYDRQ